MKPYCPIFLFSVTVSGKIYFPQRHFSETIQYVALLYTKQNTDGMLKFDWLRAGPYACVRTGVWTGVWTG